jgi:predicted nucleotidyltransferase
MATTRVAGPSLREIEPRVRRLLPHLSADERADLARILRTLVREFRPQNIYVFGSQARGDQDEHSDVDLLVVLPDAGEYPHHLAQAAYRALGHRLLSVELVFMSRDEFDWRAEVVSSLPATVLREGHVVYAAA